MNKNSAMSMLVLALLTSFITVIFIKVGDIEDTTKTPSIVSSKSVENEDLLTKEEAAKFLKLKTPEELDTLMVTQFSSDKSLNPYAGINAPYIKNIKLNGQTYFSKKQLVEWINGHLVEDTK